MKDSQLQKKPKKFIRKKESKLAPSKLQIPLRSKVGEKIIYEKAPPTTIRTKESKKIVFKKQLKKYRIYLHTFLSKIQKKSRSSRLIRKQTKPQSTQWLLKDFEKDLQLALIPLILLCILSMLMLLNNYYARIIADNKLSQVESMATIQPFPLVENILPPDLSAKAAIVLDADSQAVILSKNPDLRFSMASTTKIMTALTALDYFKEDDILTVKTVGVEGSVLGVSRGEQFVFKDLLYAMMLASANDAALVIADNYPGGREVFVKKMNEKALLMYLTNTHFSDPTGLDDDGNYTTVVDLARLGSQAMKNKIFAEAVRTKEKTIFNTFFSRQYTLVNLNRLLGTRGVNGIKTGTTEAAGEVLVTSTVAKGHTYIIVVMNSKDRFADTRELLDFVHEKVRYVLPELPR